MMPAGNCICKQSHQCTHVSIVPLDLICIDACALTQSKCSRHTCTLPLQSMPSFALSAGITQKAHSQLRSSSSCDESAWLQRCSGWQCACQTVLGMAELNHYHLSPTKAYIDRETARITKWEAHFWKNLKSFEPCGCTGMGHDSGLRPCTPEHIMTASLSSRTQQVLAVDISELDTKLVTATEGMKLFGLLYKTMAGWHNHGLKLRDQGVQAAMYNCCSVQWHAAQRASLWPSLLTFAYTYVVCSGLPFAMHSSF